MTAPLAEELALPGGADAASLARDMIEVHGAGQQTGITAWDGPPAVT